MIRAELKHLLYVYIRIVLIVLILIGILKSSMDVLSFSNTHELACFRLIYIYTNLDDMYIFIDTHARARILCVCLYVTRTSNTSDYTYIGYLV